MNDSTEDRLIRCFLSVFPGLTRGQVLSARRENIPTWDSLAGVTLVAVIQEEFHLELAPELLDDADFAFPEILSIILASDGRRTAGTEH